MVDMKKFAKSKQSSLLNSTFKDYLRNSQGAIDIDKKFDNKTQVPIL